MRSAVIAAAFAAGAFAVPHGHNHKRDIATETDYNVVYVTDVVTVTGGSKPAATTNVAAAAPSSKGGSGWSWGEWSHHWSHSSKTSAQTQAPKPTNTYQPPAPSNTEKPTTQAPAPTTKQSTQQPASTTKASQPASSPTGGLSPDDYSGIVVYHHNIHRSNHSAPDLAWSTDLEASAKEVADTCVYAHKTTGLSVSNIGQNIAAGVEGGNISAVISDLFYNGEVGYFADQYGKAQPDMTNFEKWGHFSQIVWKGTTHVGCYTKDCSSQGLANVGGSVAPFFTVCNYQSPGNYQNEYDDNVKAPKGEATANWAAGLDW